MNYVFEAQIRKYVLIFMDDILVYSKSFQEHLSHLSEVFQILTQHKLFAKLSKCSFAQNQIEYLGHIISDQGVATDPGKTSAMVQRPVPTSHTALRGFLGLTGYYRKLVKHYGILAKPLTLVLSNKAFVWIEDAQKAFDNLKQAMTSTPVLALPDFSQTFVIETDACDSGVGAVLS